VDVGVNIGQTLMQVKSLDMNRKYIGFEPNPSCNMFVEELIRVNRFENVVLVPVGLYTEDTLMGLDLYYDDITNSGGSIIKDYWAYNHIKPHRTLMVPLMSAETIQKIVPLDNVDIVKIDVEGAELEVLISLKKIIQKRKPLIVIEILSAYSKENIIRIERQNSILNLLKELNYQIFRIIEDGYANLKGLQKIDDIDPSFNKDLCNYLLVHQTEEESTLKFFKLIEV
jgi:FkbM family methyltransferase